MACWMLRSLGYVVTKETPSTASTTRMRDAATEQEKEKAGAAPAQNDIDPPTTVPETQLDVRGRDWTGSVASDGSWKAAAPFVSESPINVDGPSKTAPALDKRPGFTFLTDRDKEKNKRTRDRLRADQPFYTPTPGRKCRPEDSEPSP